MGIVAALVIFYMIFRVHRWMLARPVAAPEAAHSPVWWRRLHFWVLSLVSREGEGEGEGEGARVEHHDWGFIDYSDAAIAVSLDREAPRPRVAPVKPPAGRGPSPLDVWVAESVARGARSKDIISAGIRQWGASKSTIERSIRRAKR